jgi:hypothetical protein
MKNLACLVLTVLTMNLFGQSLKIDFGNLADKNQKWILLSDNIMGGITKSNLEYKENSLVLSGNISLENYGGFSSTKTQYSEFDLSLYKGLKIRYKSSNQQYAFTLEDSRNWTLPNYKGDFPPKSGNDWNEATLYFKDFKEYQIGEPSGRKMKQSALKNIVRMGITTTEKKAGPFFIEIDYIEFVK